MSVPQASSSGPVADGCAEQRATVTSRCEEAHRAKEAHAAAVERLRELRRDLVAVQHERTAAEAAADPALRTAAKDKARQAYEEARALADDDAGRMEATATWARAIDRVNRSGRLADRAVSAARGRAARLEDAARQAERDEQTTRMQAEQAEAGCLDARVLLAACEEQAQTEPGEHVATVFEPHGATGGHAVEITTGEGGDPLVIEEMVGGDRSTLELAAGRIAEHTGMAPAQAQLQLQELVDAIINAASEDGFLVVDPRHHFWSALTFEESRDVIAALARLGFQFEPSEGWHAGRAPSPSDLSMALAYAGHDARNMRDLPTASELRELPRSISVDARSFLAMHAPSLTVDSVVRLLGRRAAPLEPLWDAWGQVRPVLLSPRRSLGPSGS